MRCVKSGKSLADKSVMDWLMGGVCCVVRNEASHLAS